MTLKQALWEIVRDENIIITNQNIDWLLDRASKKATGDAQALKESILERKGVIEENFPSALTNEDKVSEKVKQIEEMAETILDIVHTKHNQFSMQDLAEALYNADFRKQSEWISVDERLPDKYKSVLISCEDEVRIDWIDAFGFWHDNYPYRVTHWMPLPEAPKMTRKEDEGK